MSVPDLVEKAATQLGERVRALTTSQLGNGTPCSEWDVRALVQHLVYECRWAPALYAGETVDDVGDRYEGDLLGSDPAAAYDAAAAETVAAVREPGAMERTVHLSFGDFPGSEYAMQLLTDLVVHGWDLAKGAGQDDLIDPELLDACAAWWIDQEEMYRGAGVVGPRPAIPDDADPQTRLLATFGRQR